MLYEVITQALVDVVMQDGAESLQICPAEGDGDGVHDGIADEIGVTP